jgi:hypothetical protein
MQTVTTDEAMQKLPDLVRKAQVEQALKAMNDLGNVLRREAEREGISLEELETMLETHTEFPCLSASHLQSLK